MHDTTVGNDTNVQQCENVLLDTGTTPKNNKASTFKGMSCFVGSRLNSLSRTSLTPIENMVDNGGSLSLKRSSKNVPTDADEVLLS